MGQQVQMITIKRARDMVAVEREAVRWTTRHDREDKRLNAYGKGYKAGR